MPVWTQNYDPFGNPLLSTVAAALPVVSLFYLLAVQKVAAWKAAVASFAIALALAWLLFGMPAPMVAGAVGHGFVYAIVRIIWTLLAAVFVYEVAVESGQFETIKASIGNITDDKRLQVLLVAYAFGAVLEGAGGGGAPVAICGAMMVGLGFKPFEAAVLCLIANTAPVAFGGMGNPIRTLVAVTGLPEMQLSATVGRILPFTALILPFWLIRVQTDWKRTFEVWPGLIACGGFFGCVQFFWSNYVDAALVDIMGGMLTLVWLALFFRWWRPGSAPALGARKVIVAWSPFLLLAVLVVLWGLPSFKAIVDAPTWRTPVPGLHNLVQRVAPVVAEPHTEPALFDIAWLSAVGTPTFFAGLMAGPLLGLSFRRTIAVFVRTCVRMRYSFLAILAMLGLGFITRYSGMDAVMGLALSHTGWLFPFFGTLIGWLGVALTGTDAGSNALFGSLQVITANKVGVSPVLMAAANSAGGVMGKMIDAQSIIVGCVATGIEGQEGDLFRAVLKHSIALAAIVAAIVMLYAYVIPGIVPGPQ
ncbi:MAG: lactate permease LctP family transporter [Bryobacteraceae bacterium]